MGFLKLEARAEGHRSASLSYNEIFRHLSVILARRCSERPPVFRVMENTEQQLLQLEKIAPLVPANICAKTLKRENAIASFDMHDLPAELSGIAPVEIFTLTHDQHIQSELEILTDSSDSRDSHSRIRPTSPVPVPNTMTSPPKLIVDMDGNCPDENFADAVTEL